MKYALYVLAAGATLAACDRSERPAEEINEAREETREEIRENDEVRDLTRTNEPSTNRATAAAGMHKATVEQIIDARCAREQRCDNVGPGDEYASVDACRSEIREEWRDDLNLDECPGGIVQKELDECLEEIRNENCASPFDTLDRVAACREGDLCKAIDETN